MQLLTFEEWQLENKDMIDELGEGKDCIECNGTGECECACGNIHECGYCQGTGKDGGASEFNLKRLYELQSVIDKRNLERWSQRVQSR